ncbi:hypothetical protein FCM35_KLT21215 [Carex littledalei]|uniref:DC1 domain-containing protein n=1 Tax=Carex littledalei TaxID=544730 RepID=A0A833REJ1_9POAL|nr:hypothetical protein FCM35_KLT21215 [Carex littledalei]
MESMSSVVPYGSNMPSLGNQNHQKSNLRIAFNMNKAIDCAMCNNTITDCHCFCNTCMKYLHPRCAGVNIKTVYNIHDGKKQIVLPASDELPESCHDCLRRKLLGSAITDLLLYDHKGSSTKVPAISSSITRILESTNESAHKLLECTYDDCLIHTSMLGHELEQKDYGTIYSCFGCKEKGYGPHHACQSASCSFRLHEECKSPCTSMMHPFFPGLSFVFSSSPKWKPSRKGYEALYSCNACGLDVNGYFYHSLDEQNHLHPCCANLQRQIICGESGATLVLQPKTTSKCCYCNHIRKTVDHEKTDQIWSYVSQNENFHLHVPCIIQMLSDLKDDSTGDGVIGRGGHLTLRRTIGENRMTKLELHIAAPNAKKKWETKFRTFMKYAKIALGAIIAAFLGDPTTFIVNFVVAFIS